MTVDLRKFNDLICQLTNHWELIVEAYTGLPSGLFNHKQLTAINILQDHGILDSQFNMALEIREILVKSISGFDIYSLNDTSRKEVISAIAYYLSKQKGPNSY